MSASGALRTNLALIACFAASVAMSLGASAEVINLNGVRITSVPSLSGSCGRDLVVAVTDGNQHFVTIDYTYHGIFNPLGLVMPVRTRQTQSGVLNVSVGKFTYAGELTRLSTDTMGLDCAYGSDFMFRAAQTNISQQRRDYEDQLSRREQERIAEINRRRAEEEERKRKAEQRNRDFYAMQEKQKQDALTTYRRASPENARCIINSQADIVACEQWKAREREAQNRRDAEAQQERDRIDRAQALKRQQVAQQRDYDARSELARTNPCAAAAQQAARAASDLQEIAKNTPNPPPGYMAGIKAQREQAQAALEAMCDSSRRSVQNVAPAAPSPAPPASNEQQRQYEARQRALADLEVQVQRGQQTVNDAAANTRRIQNDNTNLQDMINRMK